MGIIPDLLHKPTVGFIPTNPLIEDGQPIDPSVSVPIPIAHKFAATAVPVPELEPHGFRSRIYGFLVCPPLLLQPLLERVDLKFAHSLKFVFPRRTAPASLSFATIKASFEATFPAIARDPAAVIILSPVSILSFIKIGIP